MKGLVEPIKKKEDVEAIEKYLAQHSKRNQLIWAFGINTGLRVSDILGLNIEDVENKSYIEIKEKKTGKYKRFPLNKKLKDLIKEYLMVRKELYTLTNERPLFVGKKHCRLDRSQVYRFLNETCEELGDTFPENRIIANHTAAENVIRRVLDMPIQEAYLKESIIGNKAVKKLSFAEEFKLYEKLWS